MKLKTGLKKKSKEKFIDKASKSVLANLTFVSPHVLYAEQLARERKAKENAIRKRLTIDISATKVGCDRCLNKKADIYHAEFSMNLCNGCSEGMEMAVAAEVFDRLKKEGK